MVNIPLVHHPNPDKDGQFYVVPRNYADDKDSFDGKVYDWNWDRNYKRKIKRIKKNKHIKLNSIKKVGYVALFQQITDINIYIIHVYLMKGISYL